MNGKRPQDVEKPAVLKAIRMKEMLAEYSEFGTRRRFSFDVQGRVIKTLKEYSGDFFKGTSNLYFAMKYNLVPIGTHPHEWFMYHAAQFGYRSAISKALDAWVEVYKGALGIALSDTLTSGNFFSSFSVLHAKLFDGIRQDSGDPLAFTDKAVEFYRRNRINPGSKTIVFSDSLDLKKVSEIKNYVNGRIHDVYGIGTYLSNDVGIKPLNIVIKLIYSKQNASESYYPTIKLSDDEGKHTGEPEEIKLCKRILNLKTIS
jgi:nicotinate phosphoribosyltransferase